MQLALRHLVVSTDFSPEGDAAVETAFRLAEDHCAHVRLIHVMERVHTPNPLYAHYHPLPTPEQQREAEEAVRSALRERVPGPYADSVAYDLLVAHGAPADEIVRAAEEAGDATWIVIASRGRGCVAKLVLGSVVSRVAARASCPVLIVR